MSVKSSTTTGRSLTMLLSAKGAEDGGEEKF